MNFYIFNAGWGQFNALFKQINEYDSFNEETLTLVRCIDCNKVSLRTLLPITMISTALV